MEIMTASDVIHGYLGPLGLTRVRGSVREHSIGDVVLPGMSFLRHFELLQRGSDLTLRALTNR